MSKPKNAGKSPRYDKHKGARQPGQPPLGPAETPPVPASAPRPRATPGRVLTLDPLAPLICRSGRPFDDQAGPDSARFPPPSTVAGCLRTAWAREHGKAFGRHLMALGIAGPMLVRPIEEGGMSRYAPKPADALYFGSGDLARCVRAAPARFPDGSGADLPDGLLPVCLAQTEEEKPGTGPTWWTWDHLLEFRSGQGPSPSHAQLDAAGWSPPAGERRTHVAIDSKTLAAKSGQLFQTEGLDLSPPKGLQDDALSGLRLLVRCAEPLSPALVHLGGERRLARLEPRSDDLWPSPPDGWLARIQATKGLSLTLLTPALFSAGYRPGWIKPDPAGLLTGNPPEAPGIRLRLRAVALGRWQPHSGWDLEAQKPRAGRKLIPAGAVYWLEVLDAPELGDLAALWLTSLCDHEQDRRDGFGLALPAAWDPNSVTDCNSPS